MQEDRLDRIEEKLDKMSEAIICLARMEERMVTVFRRLDTFDDLCKKMDSRMDEYEKQSIARGQKIAFAERVFWMVLTGAVGLVFVYLR